jgi:predicted MFS family arabinose efflux permease
MTPPDTATTSGAALERPAALDPRIWLLAIGTFAVGTDNLVIAGILPVVARDLNVGVDAAGQLVTVYALAYGIGSPLMAAITGKLPRERTAIWAIGGFAVANLLCACAPNFTFLVAMRILAGLCAALYTPSAYALAVTLAPPERRGRALSTVVLGISTSTIFGVPLGTVIGHGFGWHSTFVLIAVVSAAAVIALKRARLTSPAGPEAAISVAARLAPLARPSILLALAPNLIWGVSTMVVYTYIAPIVGPGFDAETIAGLLLVYGCGGLIGSIIGGRLADRFGPIRPIVISMTVGIAMLLAWNLVNGRLMLTGLVLLVYALAGWTIGAPQQMRVIRIDPASATVTLAVNNATYYLGSALGAALGGVLLNIVPAATLPLIGAFFALLALAVLLLGAQIEQRQRLRRQPDPQSP